MPALTAIVGLSELVEINESTYWIMKNNKDMTTPILALDKKTWIKKFWTISTISNRINTINGTINGTFFNWLAIIIEHMRCRMT